MIFLLVQAHSPQVAQAQTQAVKGVAWAGVLLDQVPFDLRSFTGRENRLPFQVALPYFGEALLGAVHAQVFQMDDVHAVAELAQPRDRVAAAVLDPIGVYFKGKDGWVALLAEDVQPRAPIKRSSSKLWLW